MSRTLFILNPASRGGKNSGLIRNLKKWIQANLPQAEVRATEFAGHAAQLAQDAAAEGWKHIFAVGGDGTLSEVVNGLALVPKKNRPAVGIVSSGTGGDFARMLREEFPTTRGFDWIKAPKQISLDIGLARLSDPRGACLEKFFVNIAGVGISGEVVKRVNASGRRLGSLEYLRATLAAGFQYQAPRVEVLGDAWGKGSKLNLLLAVVANGRYFGGGMCIAPEASAWDERLDIMVVEEMSYLSLLREVPKIYLKKKIHHPKVHYDQGKRLSIRALEGNLAADMDGEYLEARQIEFEILPGALSLLVPKE